MIHRSASTGSFTGQRSAPPRTREDRGCSLTPTTLERGSTNVVVPSTLLDAALSAEPYTTSATQAVKEDNPDTKNDFDVREIARKLQDETSRILDRSTSISVGALNRNRSTGRDTNANDLEVSENLPHYRKTSLDPNFGSGFRAQLSPPIAELRRDFLPTVIEGKVQEHKQKGGREGDYFGDFAFSAHTRAGGTHRVSTFDESPTAAPVVFGRSQSGNSIARSGSRQLSHDVGIQRTGTQRSRRHTTSSTRRGSVIQRTASIVLNTVQDVKDTIRRTSIYDTYEKAKRRGTELQRSKPAMLIFEYAFYLVLIAFVYFVLIGVPLWNGAVWWLYWVFVHKFAVAGTWSITIGIAAIYAYAPLLLFFEKDPPMPADLNNIDANKTPGVHNTALMIPCYKSAKIIGPTLEAALKIFPPPHIFVIANGNSHIPLDDTELVCRPYGVNHVWSPVGSKIVAQFVGCYAAKGFKNVLLIDDDCALPPNFPIVSDRMMKNIKCIGYTIKSVGPESSPGTFCQQAQDLEYKISGIQRALAGKIGSATFPHGAISLWDTEFLIQTFYEHPGFSVSEDWFFGHVARKLGSRITMCTSTFIETETPSAVFFSSGGARGGFGEMTIFKQRFMRWNFFFVNGMYYNMAYILGSWKLGWWEIGAKLFVFQEVYETLLYLLTPFVLPISIIVRPAFFGYLFAGTFVLYFVNVIIFNEVHLRLKKERVSSACLYIYYMPYKIVLTLINVGSCYWSLYKYATYFAKRHPKIVEDEKAVDIVLKMSEAQQDSVNQGRHMTVTAIGAQIQGSVFEEDGDGVTSERRMTVTTLGPRLDMHHQPPPEPLMSPVPEEFTPGPAIRLQGELVSFGLGRRSHDSSIKIERLPRQDSEGVSPHAKRRTSPSPHTIKPTRTRSTERSGSTQRRPTFQTTRTKSTEKQTDPSIRPSLPPTKISSREITEQVSETLQVPPPTLTRIGSNETQTSRRTHLSSIRSRSRESSLHRSSNSLRRSESLRRRSSGLNQQSAETVDVTSLGFEDLMDKLAIIEERLDKNAVESVEVNFGEENRLDTDLQGGPDYRHELREQEDTEQMEFQDLERSEAEYERKTDDAKSMV